MQQRYESYRDTLMNSTDMFIYDMFVNMFQVGKNLGVGSLEMKTEKRTLERIGHVLRMKNDRIVKQTTLGWPVILEDQRKHRQTSSALYAIFRIFPSKNPLFHCRFQNPLLFENFPGSGKWHIK